MRRFSANLSEHPAVFAVTVFGMRVKTIQSFYQRAGKSLSAPTNDLAHEPNGLSTHAYDAVDDGRPYVGTARAFDTRASPDEARGGGNH